MKERIKSWVTGGIILLLLPLLITFILSGKDAMALKRKMDLEIYLPMIMCHQIPWEYEDEMLKVQAVLARSSLYFHQERKEIDHGKLKRELARFQKEREEGKISSAYERMRTAAEETRGQVITYKGSVCPGVFHRVSCGNTRDGEKVLGDSQMDFLQNVESGVDLQAADYLKGHCFTEQKLRKKISQIWPEVHLTNEKLMGQITVESRDENGYITEIRIGDRILSGEEFRRKLELSSGNFIIQEQEEKIRFLCKGVGHGLGLSQYGGNEMAKQGKSYKQILFFYFPEIALKTTTTAEKYGKTE